MHGELLKSDIVGMSMNDLAVPGEKNLRPFAKKKIFEGPSEGKKCLIDNFFS